MNIKLLRKVQAAIKQRPKQFQMSNWFSHWLDATRNNNYLHAGGCGTAACIAGWALHLSGKSRQVDTTARRYDTVDYIDMIAVAGDVLGLSGSEAGGPARNLFMVEYWPSEFRARWERVSTPVAQAKIAIARIDHFIKTKGEE